MLLNSPLKIDAARLIDFDEPWSQVRLFDADFHQGFAIDDATGDITLIDDDRLIHIGGDDFVGIATNSNWQAQAGVSGNPTDGTIYSGELHFMRGADMIVFSSDGQAFQRKIAMTLDGSPVGGSTLCKGPNSSKLYFFSFSNNTAYWEVDPVTGVTVQAAALTGVSITQIQGAVWSPEDQCFYVTSDADDSIYRVTAAGVVSGPVHAMASVGGGFLEGLDTYKGSIYTSVYLGNAGLYRLNRASMNTKPGNSSIAFVGTEVGDAASGGATAIMPSARQAGDLLVAVQAVNPSPGSPLNDTPAGWTRLAEGRRTGHGFAVYYKISDGTEGDVSFPDQGDNFAQVQVWRGVDQITPFGTPIVLGVDYGPAQSFGMPEIISAAAGNKIMCMALSGTDASSGTVDPWNNWSFPNDLVGGYQEVIDRVHPFGGGNGIALSTYDALVAGRINHGFVRHSFSESFKITMAVEMIAA